MCSPNRRLVVPDGGWGWAIVLGVALTNMFNQSLVSVFGLLFGEHLHDLGQETFGAALVMNLNSVALNFSGLITGPALKAFSPRKVAIIGSILTSAGLILSSFSSQLWEITIAYGLLVGIGLGLINPSSFIAVNSYFSTKRGQAVGLALAGTGVGQMLMPHVVRLLLDSYGFHGTTLIIGALALNGVVGASLYQPIKWHMKVEKHFGEDNMLLKQCECDTDEEPSHVELSVNNNSVNNNNNNRNKMYCNQTPLSSPTSAVTLTHDDTSIMQPISLRKRISKAMDLQLLRDPVFVSIAVGLALAYTASTNFSMLFPYFLQETAGLSRADTALCMSVLAAADLASRLTLPTITDKLKISCRMIFLIGALLLTCTRATLAQTTSRTKLIIISAVYGYVRAATVVNQNLTVSEYTNESKLAGALGLNMVTKGLFVITIGQLLGWIRDYSGSYPVCLHSQNVLLGIVLLLWTPEIVYRRYKASTKN